MGSTPDPSTQTLLPLQTQDPAFYEDQGASLNAVSPQVTGGGLPDHEFLTGFYISTKTLKFDKYEIDTLIEILSEECLSNSWVHHGQYVLNQGGEHLCYFLAIRNGRVPRKPPPWACDRVDQGKSFERFRLRDGLATRDALLLDLGGPSFWRYTTERSRET